MGDDIPADVRSVLTQALAEARAALADGDTATATDLLDTAETVARNKLPEGQRRARVRHACERARDLLESGDDAGDADHAAARAYLAAMERRLGADPD